MVSDATRRTPPRLIVMIYSVEEADGVHFLTLELVEGRSLDGKIASAGFPLDRLLEPQPYTLG